MHVAAFMNWRFHPFSDQGCPPENHYL